MKNKITFIVIIILVFVILLIPLKGSYAFYSDNKDLEIINTKVGDWKSTLGYLRMNDKNNNLSEDIQGDMYRYQGTDDVSNWICFGTTDNCGKNDDDIDKYMYRIIGITKEGQLYLLKETFIKEGENIEFSWNDKYSVDSTSVYYCSNGICPEWGSNTLFKRINGISNGKVQGAGSYGIYADTDIFVDSEYYDYLRSGDKINGGESESEWYKLITNHEWMYGDTTEENVYNVYIGKNIYDIETGQVETMHYIQDSEGSIVEDYYKWLNEPKILAKVSLMYMHDVVSAYYNGTRNSTRGNPENMANVKNSWIHYQKNGYNSLSSHEWLSTRWGIFNIDNTDVVARVVVSSGNLVDHYRLYMNGGVRPVFYLSSEVKIDAGKGIKTDPFIININ